jgi:ATP-dependent exoDNAse (exonuclease V) alpha subunit
VARGERRFSTLALLAVERRLIARALASRSAGAGTADGDAVAHALRARPSLSDEQVRMVRALTGDGAGVALVVGRAGTGKTYALAACHEAWARSGVPVFGVAVARRAARELESQTGIPGTSVAALLAGLEAGQRPPSGVVLVVDEAGMTGTRALATMLDHVERAGGKLVLVGDDRRLPAIDAGGAFAALVRRGVAIELTENRRQAVAWEREAVEHLRAGRGAEALALYLRHDRLTVVPTDEDAREALVADWWTARDPDGAVMIALQRVDVADLNRRARERMRTAGALGPAEVDLPGGRFAVGDRVLVRRNHPLLGVSNGDRATVTRVDAARGCVELDAAGRRVTLSPDFLLARTDRGDPTLVHGYAITGHAAQGLTASRAYVLADRALTREWGYTALTRGREANHLYVAANRELAREEFAPADPDPPDPVARLGRALSTSSAQPIALDIAAGRPDREAARGRIEQIEAELAEAQRASTDAMRRRAGLEARRGRWIPGRRGALEEARADDFTRQAETAGLSQELSEAQSRLDALTRAENQDRDALRPDVRATVLRRRLERATDRDVGRWMER